MQNAADGLALALQQYTGEALTVGKEALFQEGKIAPALTPEILFGQTLEQRSHGKNLVNDFITRIRHY